MRLVKFLLLLPLLYLVAGALGGALPRNTAWREAEHGVTIYVATNGVHTGLILPTRAEGVDWSRLVRAEHLADPRYAGRYLWFGWGERDFYLNTPTWADLSGATVAGAALGSNRTLMHVDHLLQPWTDARPIRLTTAQYRSLVVAVANSFDSADRAPIPGYGPADIFYPARGRYDMLRTCNSWTGRMLAKAGVRVGAWTPFSATVMQWF
jgi:uncharacterized protein (TIGR02117 family)